MADQPTEDNPAQPIEVKPSGADLEAIAEQIAAKTGQPAAQPASQPTAKTQPKIKVTGTGLDRPQPDGNRPAAETAARAKPESRQPTLDHKGKDLQPIARPKTAAQANPAAAKDETSRKLDAMSSELKSRAKAGQDADQQQPKVFDTKKYHLPIKPTRHHRQHEINPIVAVALIILAVVVIGVVAVDLDFVDVGFDLPFDLL